MLYSRKEEILLDYIERKEFFMKITITGRNLSLTDGLKNGVEKKLGKLDKFFQAETPCNVTLSTQKDMQKIEVTGSLTVK